MIFSKFIAKQLGHPSGIVGNLLGPLWNKRNAALNDIAFDHLSLNPRDHVLEVGFGGGYLIGRMSAIIADGFIAGVDVSPAMVARCGNRYRSLVQAGKLQVKCAGAESLPYPPGHFDKVCTVNSIFYWQNVPQALSEFWRVLVEGGQLVMCFTCKASLENKDFTNHGVALYEADEIERIMASAEFRAIRAVRSSDKHREFLCMTGSK